MAWDYPHNDRVTSLGTVLTDMISSVYNFLVVKFLYTRFSVGGASLLENWILEGDEQGNIPVNAFSCFCFSVHRFWLNFLWSKVMNE